MWTILIQPYFFSSWDNWFIDWISICNHFDNQLTILRAIASVFAAFLCLVSLFICFLTFYRQRNYYLIIIMIIKESEDWLRIKILGGPSLNLFSLEEAPVGVQSLVTNHWTLFSRIPSQVSGNSLTSLMLFIQFWMFSKDFSSVMSYTRMMPWQRDREREDSRSQWKLQSEHKGPVMSAWLSSLLVLWASWAHHGSSVVGRRNGLEPLLPRCVPAQSTRVQK